MQTHSSTTRKWSQLHGLPAVAIDTGKMVGSIEDFYFDLSTATIQAFQLKIGLLSHRLLPSHSITALGIDALTFNTDMDLLKDAPEVSHLGVGSTLLNYQVMSEGGNRIGEVGNVLLDTTTPSQMRLSAFELKGGLREQLSRKFPTFPANQVTRYGQHVLVISDTAARKLL